MAAELGVVVRLNNWLRDGLSDPERDREVLGTEVGVTDAETVTDGVID